MGRGNDISGKHNSSTDISTYVISIYIVVLYALRVMMTAVSTVLTANVFHWYCVGIVYRPLGSN